MGQDFLDTYRQYRQIQLIKFSFMRKEFRINLLNKITIQSKTLLLDLNWNICSRFERSQSEEHRPSIWQRFRSYDDNDVAPRRPVSTGNGPFNNGQYGATNGQFGATNGQFDATNGQYGATNGQFGANNGPFPSSGNGGGGPFAAGNGPFLAGNGTLPRPRATVKPLPAATAAVVHDQEWNQ